MRSPSSHICRKSTLGSSVVCVTWLGLALELVSRDATAYLLATLPGILKEHTLTLHGPP